MSHPDMSRNDKLSQHFGFRQNLLCQLHWAAFIIIDDYFNFFTFSFAWSNQLFAMVSKTGADRQKEYYDNNGQAVKLSKLRWRSGWRAWRLHGCLWSQWWWINPILNTFVTNWKIVTPKDILNIVIPGHLAKMDGMIFPGWYFDFGRQAGTYVVFGECLDPQNVRLTAPTFKKVLLSFRDKFHVFRWPSNIGLDMSDIFLNSDTE